MSAYHVLTPDVLEVVEQADDWLDDGVSELYKAQELGQDWARVAKIAEEAGEAVTELNRISREIPLSVADWKRVAEVSERVGKAVDALIKLTGQNPRKGVCGTQDELLAELADCALTAILAIQHFTKNNLQTDRVLVVSFGKLASRIPP